MINNWDIFACPYCSGILSCSTEFVSCATCNTLYPLRNGQPDFRLQRPKTYKVEVTVGSDFDDGFDFDHMPLKLGSEQRKMAKDFQSQGIRNSELAAYVPKAESNDALALDLGCGPKAHKLVMETAGYQYIGMDYTNPDAPILGDAHALPFHADSFDAIVSMAVLEHFQYPYLACQEVERVLKPGGYFVGSVSFMEPFHDRSFYHHSHLGVYNTLTAAGLQVHEIVPNREWSVTKSLQGMDGLARPARLLLNGVAMVDTLMQRIHPMPHRVLATAGSFYFVAAKKKRALFHLSCEFKEFV